MIGERLKMLRRKRGINQDELAAVIGVKKAAVSMYEKGRSSPNDEMKAQLARYFNVSLDYLLGVIDEPLPYYSEDAFLKLPEGLTRQEILILSEHIGYFEYKRMQRA